MINFIKKLRHEYEKGLAQIQKEAEERYEIRWISSRNLLYIHNLTSDRPKNYLLDIKSSGEIYFYNSVNPNAAKALGLKLDDAGRLEMYREEK